MQVIRYIRDHQRLLARNAVAAVLGVACAILIVSAFAVKAADKGGPRAAQSDVPYMPPAATGWNGCGVGASAGLVNADADFGAPINMGANGQKAGTGLYCDRVFDRFVIGLFADYEWTFGDLKTLNVDRDITIGGRVGFLATPVILAYALVAASRVDFGSQHVNGVKVGGGLEMKLPGAPFFVAMEYQKATYTNVMGSTVDVNADEIMLRLRYKFSMDR